MGVGSRGGQEKAERIGVVFLFNRRLGWKILEREGEKKSKVGFGFGREKKSTIKNLFKMRGRVVCSGQKEECRELGRGEKEEVLIFVQEKKRILGFGLRPFFGFLSFCFFISCMHSSILLLRKFMKLCDHDFVTSLIKIFLVHEHDAFLFRV